jgi:hypothetical protein
MVHSLDFPEADVNDLLTLYAHLAGKKLICDFKPLGRVTMIVGWELTKDEVIRLIEMAVRVIGIDLVETEDGKGVTVIEPVETRKVTIPILSAAAKLPSGEELVSFVLKLQTLDPIEMADWVRAYAHDPGLYPLPRGCVRSLPLPNSHAIVFTGTTTEVRTLLEIFRELDVPAPRPQSGQKAPGDHP